MHGQIFPQDATASSIHADGHLPLPGDMESSSTPGAEHRRHRGALLRRTIAVGPFCIEDDASGPILIEKRCFARRESARRRINIGAPLFCFEGRGQSDPRQQRRFLWGA